MSKINDEKARILGYISALRTMLDNYPTLTTSDTMEKLLNSNSPLGLLLNIAEICGISHEMLLNWISKILCGAETIKSAGTRLGDKAATSLSNAADETTGILDVIEEAVKVILLTNVKDLFTCTLNPFIPREVMYHPYGINLKSAKSDSEDKDYRYDGGVEMGKGIEISIPTIDMLNVLAFAPNATNGKAFYFDNDYIPYEMWKSTDFNAFLWYIINKSNNIKEGKYKCIWDNRVKHRKELKNNEIFRSNFFNLYSAEGGNISTTKGQTPNSKNINHQWNDNFQNAEEPLTKRQYLYIEYQERSSTTSVPDVLKIYLDADRYLRKYSIPRTVFEFDFDYIYSLKLFNSKTIVANVINSIIGIGRSAAASVANGKYSLQQQIIAGKVSEITKKLMQGDDTVIDDCSFSFSNDEYNTLLEQAELKYKNRYKVNGKEHQVTDDEISEISDLLNGLSSSATLQEQQTKIANVFTQVSAKAAQNGQISESDKFTFGESIIFDLIEQSVTQIVMQVLSPKVMVLYALNSYFMGDAADGDFSKINVENLLKGLANLIQKLVKQVLEIILQELLKFVLEEVMDLVLLMIEKLLLERIRFYVELLRRLLALLDMFMKNNSKKSDTIIDNVNYADIVPEQTKPNNTDNCK